MNFGDLVGWFLATKLTWVNLPSYSIYVIKAAYIQNARHSCCKLSPKPGVGQPSNYRWYDKYQRLTKGCAKCPISQFNQWPFCGSDLWAVLTLKLGLLDFTSILPNGYMQSQPGSPSRGTNGRTQNGLIPSTSKSATLWSICHDTVYWLHSRRKPKGHFYLLSSSPFYLLTNGSFSWEEAPIWTASLPYHIANRVWINLIGSARAHTNWMYWDHRLKKNLNT